MSNAPAHPWPKPSPTFDADLAALQAEFASWGVRHFTAKECCKLNAIHAGEPTHAVPPREIWLNMRATLVAADAIRSVWGAPIVVVSGYRPPAYNGRDPGKAKASLHMMFAALDLKPAAGFKDAAEYKRYLDVCEDAVTAAAKALGVSSGLGNYPSRWVHIDLGQRTARTRWDG